jgi:DNA-binding CsgD family transcriptional regulator
LEVWALTAPISLAFLDGRLEEMIELVETQRGLGQESGILGVQFGAGYPLTKIPNARAHDMLGRDVAPLLRDFEGSSARTIAARALVLSYLGRSDEVLALIASVGNIGSPDDETWLMSLADLLEASVRCRDSVSAAALVRRLAPLASGLQGYLVSFGRLLGEAAVMLGQFDASRGFYLEAIDVCHKTRFRPELALSRLDLAELLLGHYESDRGEALQHLTLAANELRAMHMQPALDRAERLASAEAAGAASYPLLTAREQEVAALVGRGMSNRDIAAALVITEGTAEVHVKHILGKLGLRSRHQIGRLAG